MEAPFVMVVVLEIKCFRRRARANPFGRTISKQLLVWHFTIWTRGTTLSGFSPVCLLELYSTAFLSLLWQLTGQTFWGRSINKPKAGGWSRKSGSTPFNACSSIWNCPTRSSLCALLNSMLSKYWAGFKGERQTDRTTPVLERALGATTSICRCLFEQLCGNSLRMSTSSMEPHRKSQYFQFFVLIFRYMDFDHGHTGLHEYFIENMILGISKDKYC